MYKAPRGTQDILPSEQDYWAFVYQKAQTLCQLYGYERLETPMFEEAGLFQRSIGEGTDIVEKEMYAFEDHGGDLMTLRPEGTAGCVRAGVEQGLLYNQTQRLWYMGPMFRHERPQKGRYRQFHQFGVEAFGLPGPDIDAEHIFIMARLFKILGIDSEIELQINSLGNKAVRSRYHNDLEKYFTKHIDVLDDDSKRRLHSNPLRSQIAQSSFFDSLKTSTKPCSDNAL